ncbi:MAG: type III pantothenate kinase [Candidatus Faecivivens sp.]|nr:type III pantothenate kinase [Oscillospiraceae bacterium]MDY2712283.1 type III pantothenate kinase [Candidatus Faecivivens sp.]
MILAADVSNAYVSIGCIDKRGIYFTSRFATVSGKTEDEYAVDLHRTLEINGVPPEKLDGCIISSVVPPMNFTLSRALEIVTGKKPLIIGPGVKTGLNIRIENPTQLGSNLVVDAVAALDRYSAPMIVLDMGTSTTASVINRAGQYIGGFISPGVRISQEAGASGTAQLPRIGLEAPETVIGKNTVHCLQSGAVYGTAAMIDGMIARIAEELGEEESALNVIATGGALERTITACCEHKILFDSDLVLHGLWLIWQKNQKRA